MKKSVLLACSMLVAFSASSALAFNPRTQYRMRPTIEINLDALNKLQNDQAPVPTGPGRAEDASPFGDASKTDKAKPHKSHKRKHKKHAVKHKNSSTGCPPIQQDQAEKVPEVKVAPREVENTAEPVPQLAPLPGREAPAPAAPVPVKSAHKAEPLPSAKKKAAAPVAPAMPEPKEQPLALPTVSAPAPAAPPSALPPLPGGGKEALPPAPPATGSSNANESPVMPVAPLPKSAPAAGAQALPPLPGDKGAIDAKELQPVAGGGTPPALPPLPGSADSKGAADVSALPPLPGDAEPAAAASGKKGAATASAPDERIVFNANETELPLGASAKLDMIAAQLTAHPNLRASVVAYAAGSDAVSIYPKRVSLARGISVRNYLVTTKGIDVERVTVKALGNKNESGPADRVDVLIIK